MKKQQQAALPTLTLESPVYEDALTAPLTAEERAMVPVVAAPIAPVTETQIVPPTVAADNVLGAILQLAAAPEKLDVNLVERLIGLHERMEDRQAAREFNEAFVRMQAKLPRVKRDGRLEYPEDKNQPRGPKYLAAKYAKWETIHAGIMPILTEHGFGLSFKIKPRTQDGGGLGVIPVLRHSGGHVEEGEPFPVPLDTTGGKNNAQAYGSTLSYGKKYAAFAALNIATEGEDDDGRAAGDIMIDAEQCATIRRGLKKVGEDEGDFIAGATQGLTRSAAEVPVRYFGTIINTLTALVREKEGDPSGVR